MRRSKGECRGVRGSGVKGREGECRDARCPQFEDLGGTSFHLLQSQFILNQTFACVIKFSDTLHAIVTKNNQFLIIAYDISV